MNKVLKGDLSLEDFFTLKLKLVRTYTLDKHNNNLVNEIESEE